MKTPSANFARGLTSQSLGEPDPELARAQHRAYQRGLQELGYEIILLPPDELPDSCFVEDMAVVAAPLIVASRSAVRAEEQAPVLQALGQALPEYGLNPIQQPGLLEGGDVLRLGQHFLVGLTERTNQAGFEQFRDGLQPLGYTAATLEVGELLHLKAGVSRLNDRTVLALAQLAPEFLKLGYEVVVVEAEDWHAANALAVGSRVLLPAGYPRVVRALSERGFSALEVDLSEFRKQDGGASCLSILLEAGE